MKKLIVISFFVAVGTTVLAQGRYSMHNQQDTPELTNYISKETKLVQKEQPKTPATTDKDSFMHANNLRHVADISTTDTTPMRNDLRIQNVQKQPSSGDKFFGLTRKIPYNRMIPPYGLEVTFDKTVHVIFPAPIKYVDLGSDVLIAAIAGDATNVLRVKSVDEWFAGETNMSVITENGSFYAFNVRFETEPEKLSIEMQDFMHDGEAVNRPNNSMDIFLKELGSESPTLVRIIMKSIYDSDRRVIKHIGARGFGISFLLKGIYSHNGMLYFYTEITNSTNVKYDIDYLTIKVVDKKLIQRTTIQETVLKPVRAYNYVTEVAAKSTETTVLAIPTFTIPSDKLLIFDLNEKNNGGRNYDFEVENADLVRAKVITDFAIQY